MKRILFVDDEISVLEGLRLVLRHREHEWAMTFVDSGARAINEFQTEPYDVSLNLGFCHPRTPRGRCIAYVRHVASAYGIRVTTSKASAQ